MAMPARRKRTGAALLLALAAIGAKEICSTSTTFLAAGGDSQRMILARPWSVDVETRSLLAGAPVQALSSRTALTARRVFGLGTSEILVILGVAALFFGPEGLKMFAKEAGKAAADLKDVPKAFEEGMEEEAAKKLAAKADSPGEEKKLDGAGRRAAVGGLVAYGFCANCAPASANVGEGDTLPNGARQEDRIRKGMDAWKEQGRKMSAGEITTEEEWQNLQGFLRRLYSLNDDMTYLAKGLVADKKKKAEEIVAVFKKRVKLADKPAKAKDAAEFMEFHKEITGYLDEFVPLLSDAPEDLVEAGEELEVAIS